MSTAQVKTAPRKTAAPRTPTKKASAKPASRAKATALAKVVKPLAPERSAKTAQPAKDDAKAKKPKLVRDSFTIPKAEYEVLKALKDRTAKLGRPTKKSELLRAGIKLLSTLGDAALVAAVAAVPAIKTGRPAKDA